MDKAALRRDLLRDEGVVLHAYEDSRGFLTLGVGRLVDARHGGGITEAEAMTLLDNDIAAVSANLREYFGFFDALDDVRQRALANMRFQLGLPRLLGFHRMLAAIEAGDWSAAHDECLDSAYARQTPHRARRVAYMLLTGQALL